MSLPENQQENTQTHYDPQEQITKAQLLSNLHRSDKLLVLPNIWDPLGAALLENIGYPAVATGSMSVAIAGGYTDGENMPFEEVLAVLKKIVTRVRVPVTADIESGYSLTSEGLASNIRQLIATGIAGINIEDSHRQTGELLPVDVQAERIRLIRTTAENMGIPLFINARTDAFMKAELSPEQQWQETLARSNAYLTAGADGIFPIFLKEKDLIQKLVNAIPAPINILARPGAPDLKTLKEAGVARVSFGPSFMKAILQKMKELAEAIQKGEGHDIVTGDMVTHDFLNGLIPSSDSAL
ncbi:isocitrate lyase/PEP mutase family protein [Flavitalea flava]